MKLNGVRTNEHVRSSFEILTDNRNCPTGPHRSRMETRTLRLHCYQSIYKPSKSLSYSRDKSRACSPRISFGAWHMEVTGFQRFVDALVAVQPKITSFHPT